MEKVKYILGQPKSNNYNYKENNWDNVMENAGLSFYIGDSYFVAIPLT